MAIRTPQYFEEKRHALIRKLPSQWREEAEEVIDFVDIIGNSQFTVFEGRRQSLKQIINTLHSRRTGPSDEEIPFVVHPEFPYADVVRERMIGWMTKALKIDASLVAMLCDGAIESFSQDMRRIIEEAETAIVMPSVRDVILTDTGRRIIAPSTLLRVINTDYEGATGYLQTATLGHLAKVFGTDLIDKKLKVHGASFALCTDNTALQMLAMRELGLMVGGEALHEWEYEIEKIHLAMLECGMALESGISRGTQIDCLGLAARFKEQPTNARASSTLNDDRTVVYPTDYCSIAAAPFVERQ